MLDRRSLLLAGAAALSGCAALRQRTPETQSESADAAFRTIVERLPARSRTARPFIVRRFNADTLSPQGRILYEAILPGIEADAALERATFGETGAPYAVTHRNGLYRRASELRPSDDHRAGARAIIRETARLEGDAARGIIAPDFVLDATIPVLDAAVTRIRASSDPAHEASGEALARQLEVLRAQRPGARAEAGVWRLPGGEEFYAAVLAFHLGAQVDAREAHAQALEQCRVLHAEADTLLRQQGLRQGGVAERLRALAQDERHLYPATAAGKDAAIDDMRATLVRVRTLIAPVFEGVDLEAGDVRALPTAQEAAGAAGRRQGEDYLVDLGDIRARPRWSLPSVVHHEVTPGHLLQAPFERAVRVPELQRRYSFAYSEGWATYAEILADELGAYADDPLARIGYLQWMLFRHARIAVDTGMHVMRWTREESVARMRDLQGQSIAFVSIEEDVTRMAVQPGAYAAQGLAASHMIALRERTRRAQGGDFRLSAFHAALLRHGPLSPPGLEQAVRAGA